MNEKSGTQSVIKNSSITFTLIIVLVAGMANIVTDLTVGLVPGVGDVANSFLDTIFLILQLGSVAYLKLHGIEYTPNE